MNSKDPSRTHAASEGKKSGPDTRLIFGDNVRRFRERSGLKQEALAFEIGVDQAYVSRMERGLVNPTIEMIERIASALNVSPAHLLGADENE